MSPRVIKEIDNTWLDIKRILTVHCTYVSNSREFILNREFFLRICFSYGESEMKSILVSSGLFFL